MRDMALSIAVLLVPLAVFYGLWNWAAGDRQVSVVDTSEDYSAAEALGVDVVRPELPEEWKPISSALAVEGEVVTLRTGWYSPGGRGLQLVQTTGEPVEVDEELTGVGEPVAAGGVGWVSYDIADGRAWVVELGGTTVILTAEPEGIDALPDLAEGVTQGRSG